MKKDSYHNKSIISNSINPKISCRKFLRRTASFTIGTVAVGLSLAEVLEKKGNIAIVVLPDDDIAPLVSPTWALGELKKNLKKYGASVRQVQKITEMKFGEFCVLASGRPYAIKTILNKNT